MCAGHPTNLRTRYLNRCVSNRDPRAILLAEQYRNSTSSYSCALNSKDAPTLSSNRPANAFSNSEIPLTLREDISGQCISPDYNSEVQKAMVNAAINLMDTRDGVRRLVFELVKNANESQALLRESGQVDLFCLVFR